LEETADGKKTRRRYAPSASKDVKSEMHRYKLGTAKSGPSGKGGKVKSRKQAVEPNKRLLAILGPGLIAGASDDDPSGIATYSQAGAQFGFSITWTLFFTYPLMAVIQKSVDGLDEPLVKELLPISATTIRTGFCRALLHCSSSLTR
jgi:hypothetical protein